jgi:hypothetical protein
VHLHACFIINNNIETRFIRCASGILLAIVQV